MATIFLDRDGVINENRADYVKSWAEFRFLPGAKEAIAMLTGAGHRIIVCTNQAGIAGGSIAREALEDIHDRMLKEVAWAGGVIEKVYYCPHAKNVGCGCRKPRPGMLLRAQGELGLDLEEAVFIGDSMTDIRAGLAAGVCTILVLTGLGLEQFCKYHQEAEGQFRIMMSLHHAAESIIAGRYMHVSAPSSLERACYSSIGMSR